jgi:GAF domain-containing protein
MTDIPFQAALITPVSWQGKVTGVLIIMRTQPGQLFTQDDENSAQLLVAQVAAAFQNVALAEQRQRTLDELNNLNRRLIGQAWRDYTRPAGGALHLVDVGPGVSATGTAQPDGGLTAPIVMRGETIGTLSLQDLNPNRAWSTNEVALINAVANEIAIAVENARLIEQTERHAQREARLSQIAQRLRQATDIDSILQTASEELSHALGTSHAQAQLGAPMPPPDHQHGNGQGGSNA